jgi:hypothetical protein
MTNNEPIGCVELPKLLNNGTNNNYSLWKNWAYYKLQEWGLWKYIKGLGSKPPIVPSLCPMTIYHGLDDDGVTRDITHVTRRGDSSSS